MCELFLHCWAGMSTQGGGEQAGVVVAPYRSRFGSGVVSFCHQLLGGTQQKYEELASIARHAGGVRQTWHRHMRQELFGQQSGVYIQLKVAVVCAVRCDVQRSRGAWLLQHWSNKQYRQLLVSLPGQSVSRSGCLALAGRLVTWPRWLVPMLGATASILLEAGAAASVCEVEQFSLCKIWSLCVLGADMFSIDCPHRRACAALLHHQLDTNTCLAVGDSHAVGCCSDSQPGEMQAVQSWCSAGQPTGAAAADRPPPVNTSVYRSACYTHNQSVASAQPLQVIAVISGPPGAPAAAEPCCSNRLHHTRHTGGMHIRAHTRRYAHQSTHQALGPGGIHPASQPVHCIVMAASAPLQRSTSDQHATSGS